MAVDDELQRLIEEPRESLTVELKNWLNLTDINDQAKIIKTVLSLRNNNGGYMVFGFDDKTLQPVTPVPYDPLAAFHQDTLQALITKFSSEPFEVEVSFPQANGVLHPVLKIPGGIKTVVACRSELKDAKGKVLIGVDDVYVRSLNANHTPSTTKAGWKDWPQLIETCFNNREADIGQFLRRHLNSEAVANLASILAPPTPPPRKEETVLSFLDYGRNRFEEIRTERKVSLPDHGFWECALIINGDVPIHKANKEFLRLLDANNPRYTGWPIWMNTEGFRDRESHPRVHNHAWEVFLVSLDSAISDHIDFMHYDPKGCFYIRRSYEDDLGGGARKPKPLSVLDFGLIILRVTETLAVGLAYAKAMGCDPETTTLSFGFRWNRLQNRDLSSWANPSRYLSGGRVAYQNEVLAYAEIPLNTPLSRIGEYSKQVIDPLFEVFDGFEISQDVIDDLAQRLINRRL